MDAAKIVSAMFDAFERRDWEQFALYIADDIVYTDSGRVEPVVGKEAYLETVRRMVKAHPDIQFHPRMLFTEGNKVAAEGVTTETIKDRQVGFRWAEIFEVEQGKIKQARFYYDSAEISRQLNG